MRKANCTTPKDKVLKRNANCVIAQCMRKRPALVIDMGTFKYHMIPKEGGFAQTVRVPSYGEEGGLAKSSYNFYSG